METSAMLNMDLTKAICLRSVEQAWVSSLADGVSCCLLECEDKESGRTTSFVKFEAGSFFPQLDRHPGLEHYSLTTVLFPALIAGACSGLIILVADRRRVLSEAT
jgi:hypothetical protein